MKHFEQKLEEKDSDHLLNHLRDSTVVGSLSCFSLGCLQKRFEGMQT